MTTKQTGGDESLAVELREVARNYRVYGEMQHISMFNAAADRIEKLEQELTAIEFILMLRSDEWPNEMLRIRRALEEIKASGGDVHGGAADWASAHLSLRAIASRALAGEGETTDE